MKYKKYFVIFNFFILFFFFNIFIRNSFIVSIIIIKTRISFIKKFHHLLNSFPSNKISINNNNINSPYNTCFSWMKTLFPFGMIIIFILRINKKIYGQSQMLKQDIFIKSNFKFNLIFHIALLLRIIIK